MRQLGDLAIATNAATNPTTNDTNWFQNVLTNITQAGAAYLSLKQQQDLQRVNLSRLQAGYAPLNADDYAAQVRVGLDPTTRNLLFGGVAAVLLVLLLKRK